MLLVTAHSASSGDKRAHRLGPIAMRPTEFVGPLHEDRFQIPHALRPGLASESEAGDPHDAAVNAFEEDHATNERSKGADDRSLSIIIVAYGVAKGKGACREDRGRA